MEGTEERRLSTTGESLYLTLGVPKTATLDEVRKAYRKQALVLHPDKNRGDPAAAERFQEVKRAYSVLSSLSSRQVYDRYGSTGVSLWEKLLKEQADRLLMEAAASGACGCLTVLCGLFTCCYCCCCCCTSPCCCRRVDPDHLNGEADSGAATDQTTDFVTSLGNRLVTKSVSFISRQPTARLALVQPPPVDTLDHPSLNEAPSQ